ncbi:PITH domain-containing protein [Neolecta irregularis DAH-3]|uniref:PITH domain-containing protein n=1 Tax=Neolecta irregularis (strain DAH-3) TaxID=1198029 RepID=A0A1U7LUX4_NEOID|nr:PITH domain-containing protein [Neolecta irregularis DAH-3]|eukprot:OLL26418.1 PITH domain-containing protein [Neolecta irregularis DAH-3]
MTPTPCSHEHDHDHDHDAPLVSGAADSLYEYIDRDNVRALNEAEEGMGKAIIKPWDSRLDTTQAASQRFRPANHSPYPVSSLQNIILNPSFTGLVKLKSILLRAPCSQESPNSLKIYINRDDLDFSTAADAKPTHTIECAQSNEIIEYPVKPALFANCQSITLFIESSWGADVTTLWYLGLRGEWKKLSKNPVITLYEAAANPSDHKNAVPGANMNSWGTGS